MDYNEFIKSKALFDEPTGIKEEPNINGMLFEFQRDIVRWALMRGRAAIFADCGLGKSPMQLEWARCVTEHTGRPVLIVAPLAVTTQTIGEGVKFDVHVEKATGAEVFGQGIYITNYEQLHKHDPSNYSGIVLDESSILKSYTGKYRNELIDNWGSIQFRLACTATPAPNDFMELGNHAEFIGSMTRTEMLSMFFIHDSGETQKWRLKGHAESEFWKWLSSWAVMIRKPSDLGYDDGDFILPELRMHNREVAVGENDSADGMLFRLPASTLQERQKERKLTIDDRVQECVDLIAERPDEQWLIWCNLNSESDALKKAIANSTEVKGSDSPEHKVAALHGFTNGDPQILISKPSIAGWGMNWQHCQNVAFVGLSDSYEQFYQAVRQCWRFGQKKPVDCYVITAETEGAVVANIKRKEEDADKMAREMVKHMQSYNQENIKGITRTESVYMEESKEGKNWKAHLGDSCEVIKTIETGSIDYTIFSPPFASLYTYSNSDRDMGNCKSDDEFMQHFGEFLVPELLRVTRPGRLLSFHCMNIPAMKSRDGYMGLHDFRGKLIKMFQDVGWIFHSEVCIWKDPLLEATRTKAHGLMHKQICKDSSMCRQGIPDYLITMRKDGENDKPLAHPHGLNGKVCDQRANTGSHVMWRKLASPVWMDINQTRTLQYRGARSDKDERHICPLQLDVIERGVQLWSVEGDTVFSPFMGIGSEGYVSVGMGRKFVGIELKSSYFDVACKNLNAAQSKCADLWD